MRIDPSSALTIATADVGPDPILRFWIPFKQFMKVAQASLHAYCVVSLYTATRKRMPKKATSNKLQKQNAGDKAAQAFTQSGLRMESWLGSLARALRRCRQIWNCLSKSSTREIFGPISSSSLRFANVWPQLCHNDFCHDCCIR
jgi:hypothetical protein